MSRLLRPDVRCPNCGKRPRIRIVEAEQDVAKRQPAEELKGTYQCHNCGVVYPLRAGAYHGAA